MQTRCAKPQSNADGALLDGTTVEALGGKTPRTKQADVQLTQLHMRFLSPILWLSSTSGKGPDLLQLIRSLHANTDCNNHHRQLLMKLQPKKELQMLHEVDLYMQKNLNITLP